MVALFLSVLLVSNVRHSTTDHLNPLCQHRAAKNEDQDSRDAVVRPPTLSAVLTHAPFCAARQLPISSGSHGCGGRYNSSPRYPTHRYHWYTSKLEQPTHTHTGIVEQSFPRRLVRKYRPRSVRIQHGTSSQTRAGEQAVSRDRHSALAVKPHMSYFSHYSSGKTGSRS